MNDNNNKRSRRFVIRDYKGAVPIFFQPEVHLDRMLGQGSFCAAWTIKQVHLCDDERSKTLPNQENRRSLADQLSEARKSHGKAPLLRCVVKKPRNDFYANVHNGDQSLTDLRYELKLLHRVGMGQHPNIIQLHGIGASLIENDKEKPQQSGVTFKLSFLILSRIRYTIEELMVQWRDQRGPGVKQALAIDQNATRQVWKERMSALAQVADALRYLHSNRIILRDLKPENVGQDYRGVVKVYDLGLATQIEKENHGIDKLYRLTGNTGTLRYMSPEIGNRKKYGYSADVYSLAIVMHEVLSLKTPFAGMSSKAHSERVHNRGVRPSLDGGWPQPLRELIQSMWVADPTERPNASEVSKALSAMLQGSDDNLFPSALFSKNRWFPAK